ncbi:MAG TPA: hypothetical protein VF559_01070, partial [Caulobacteraceae bacterium]
PCVKEAGSARIERAASDGLIVPCIKEPDRITIDWMADEGLIVPCVKEADGLITPCIREAGSSRIERAVNDGQLVPCIKEADTFMIAAQRGVFVLGTQARANGETLIENPVSERPYWDQNSRDTYDPAPEVVVSSRPLLYSGDFFLIA